MRQRRFTPARRPGRAAGGGRRNGHGVAHLDVPRRPREPEAGEAPEHFLEGDLHLQAREQLARALVDAEAEAQLPARGRVGDVEGVRVGEAVGVAVGGDQGSHHRLTGPDHLSGQLDVLQGGPGGTRVDDGLVPHELFHGVLGEAGVVARVMMSQIASGVRTEPAGATGRANSVWPEWAGRTVDRDARLTL